MNRRNKIAGNEIFKMRVALIKFKKNNVIASLAIIVKCDKDYTTRDQQKTAFLKKFYKFNPRVKRSAATSYAALKLVGF